MRDLVSSLSLSLSIWRSRLVLHDDSYVESCTVSVIPRITVPPNAVLRYWKRLASRINCPDWCTRNYKFISLIDEIEITFLLILEETISATD